MALKIKDHGRWETYRPERIPVGIPAALAARMIFIQRVGDHQDWYELVRTRGAFDPDSVKMTVYDVAGGHRQVQAVTRDVSRLCPQGSVVLEVWGIEDADPQETHGYGRLRYMPESQSFEPMPPPVPWEITRRQFYHQLTIKGVISEDEALAAMTGTSPRALLADTFAVKMLLAGTGFRRDDAALKTFAAAMKWSEAELDDLFIKAAAL